jgi:pimeloyl-ACP methyl ester carboxylesterase
LQLNDAEEGMKTGYIALLAACLCLLTAPSAALDKVTTESVIEPVFGGEVLVVEAGPAEAESVVLVHGLGEAGWHDWSDQVALLSESYHVVTFDLPGFARSEKQNTLYSPLLYAAFVKWLVDRYVDGDFTLVGHSMGGAIALRFAATFPRGLKRLILIDVAGILHEAAFTRFHAIHQIEGVLKEYPRSQRALSKLTSRLIHRVNPPIDPETILGSRSLRKQLLAGEPMRIAALALVEEDFSRLSAEVSVPTLLIWGEEDDVAPLRVGYLLSARIAGATLEILPGVGHTPMTEQPELVNQILTDTLTAPQMDEKEVEPIIADLTPGSSLVAQSLTESVTMKEPAPAVEDETAVADVANQGIGRCNQEAGVTFTGSYRRIEIDQCTGVLLHHVEAEEVRISRSRAVLLDCQITGAAIPLVVRDSAVTATNLTVEGEIALLVAESYLDLAGADLIGSQASALAEKKSFFIFSMSSIASPVAKTRLHDVVKLKKDEHL